MALGYPSAANAADTLYAVTGASCSPGTLYTLNPTNGVATQVANVTIGATQVNDLTGLAIDPTTDTAYGWFNDNDCSFNSGTGTLLTINKSTGAATVIGTGAAQIADITFDRFGNLYGWSGGCGQNNCNEGGSDLYTINKATGAATKVSESGTYGFSTGLASDSNGQMYMKSYQGLFRINPFTGHAFAPVGLSNGSTRNLLTFGPSDVLYTGSRNCCGGLQLQTLNKTTGVISNVGFPNGVFNISAIDWDFDSPSTPNQADVSLTNTASTPTPSVGGSVTFTVDVANAGAAGSTIVVKDKLPSGFTFVSATPSAGTYDSATGIWNVGALASGGSADLDIVATANATGNHTNNAEVMSADTYDPDSVPGSGEGDTFDVARSIPATSPVFYASSGSGNQFCGGTPSFLYELDTSGGISQVAPITIGGQQVLHVNGLAVDPGTGTLYGYMNTQSPDCDEHAGTLITIDKDTGAATIVGSEGDAGIRSPDMTSDPFGALYVWNASFGFDDLYTLDKTTGTSSIVGECGGCFTSQTGLGDDSLGRLYVKASNQLYRVDQFTGHLFGGLTLSQNAQNMLAFGPSDALYTGNRTSTNSVINGFQLRQIDRSTGTVTLLGSNSVLHISALAWDLRTYTPPAVADLRLSKAVDHSTATDYGEQFTFTITVTNDGPSTATGVKVKDLLPSGFDYVSNNPSVGSYSSTTGIWDVGSIANGAAPTLQLIGAIRSTGSYINEAEVVETTTYDTDSVPGAGETTEDTYASQTVSTGGLSPNVNAAATVSVGGGTRSAANSKGFSVQISNVGSQSFSVDQSMLDANVARNSTDTNQVTCKPFSATLRPGRSTRAHCTFNVAAAGLSPGDQVKYHATVDVPADGFTNNDYSEVIHTAS